MSPTALKFLTDFGDTAFTLPLAAAVLAWALWLRAWPLARAWALSLACAAFGISILKIIGYSCHNYLLGQTLISPSGHAAISTAVYGGLTLIAIDRLPRPWRLPAALAGLALVIGIGITRVVLHAHTQDEVLVGWLWGGLSCCLFARLWQHRRPLHIPLRPAAALALLLFLLHGQSISAEDRIQQISGWLKIETDLCR